MMRRFSSQETKLLRKKFASAKPFPHVVVENFLTNHKKLLKALKKEKFYGKNTDLFSFKQTSNLFFSKNRGIKEAVAMLSSAEFAKLISKISALELKPGAVDVFGALYESADYLLCHDDKLEGRKVAFILYLSESFSRHDGGALALLSSKGKHPDRKKVSYPPLENSLLIFGVSEKSWHEVEEVLSSKKRYTIGGWLH